MKAKARKSSTVEKANIKTEKPKRSEGKPKDPSEIQAWVEDGDCQYFVKISGVKQAAVLWAHSRAEAKEKFQELFGITSCERPIKVEEVDEEHGYEINEHGVVDPATL